MAINRNWRPGSSFPLASDTVFLAANDVVCYSHDRPPLFSRMPATSSALPPIDPFNPTRQPPLTADLVGVVDGRPASVASSPSPSRNQPETQTRKEAQWRRFDHSARNVPATLSKKKSWMEIRKMKLKEKRHEKTLKRPWKMEDGQTDRNRRWIRISTAHSHDRFPSPHLLPQTKENPAKNPLFRAFPQLEPWDFWPGISRETLKPFFLFSYIFSFWRSK